MKPTESIGRVKFGGNFERFSAVKKFSRLFPTAGGVS
jgi:hypothetical protein